MIYNFEERLAFSHGTSEIKIFDTIKYMIPGCMDVREATVEQDRKGIDYIATLRQGREINIDHKRRDVGCSKYWSHGPEFALEKWSVLPRGKYEIPLARSKAGWTLDESKDTEMVFFHYDPSDSIECFLVSFQLLRMAFIRYIDSWMGYQNQKDEWIQKGQWKVDKQDSSRWESQCVFVPAWVVFDAMNEVSSGQLVQELG